MRYLIITAIVGGLALPPSLSAKEQIKKSISPNESYTLAFNSAFSDVNKALVNYAHTDCTAPEFNGTVTVFKDAMHTLSVLIQNMPDSLDDESKLAFTEEGYGVLYIANSITELQNNCVDEHTGSY